MTTRTKPCRVHIAHKVNHRTRFKLGGNCNTPQNIERVKAMLEETDGVHSVAINKATGSVVVNHKHGEEVTKQFSSVLSGLMCECAEMAIEAVEPELSLPLAILGKLIPFAEEANPQLKDFVVPLSLVACGFAGGLYARAFLSRISLPAIVEFIPFL